MGPLNSAACRSQGQPDFSRDSSCLHALLSGYMVRFAVHEKMDYPNVTVAFSLPLCVYVCFCVIEIQVR